MREALNPRLNLRVWRELIELKRTAEVAQEPVIPEIVLIEAGKIVWRIALSPTRSAFLSEVVPNYGKKFVAYVHAGKFYSQWRRQSLLRPGDLQGCPRLDDMDRDYKYPSAVRGFTHGGANPVPLADIVFLKGIGFTNGITRTLWLIRNGAQSFPVATSCEESSLRLARELGVSRVIICLEGS